MIPETTNIKYIVTIPQSTPNNVQQNNIDDRTQQIATESMQAIKFLFQGEFRRFCHPINDLSIRTIQLKAAWFYGLNDQHQIRLRYIDSGRHFVTFSTDDEVKEALKFYDKTNKTLFIEITLVSTNKVPCNNQGKQN